MQHPTQNAVILYSWCFYRIFIIVHLSNGSCVYMYIRSYHAYFISYLLSYRIMRVHVSCVHSILSHAFFIVRVPFCIMRLSYRCRFYILFSLYFAFIRFIMFIRLCVSSFPLVVKYHTLLVSIIPTILCTTVVSHETSGYSLAAIT
jgi:hypothetical protein